jgi:hypothetical protein
LKLIDVMKDYHAEGLIDKYNAAEERLPRIKNKRNEKHRKVKDILESMQHVKYL